MSQTPPEPELSWPRRVARRFLDVFGRGYAPRPGRHLDHLDYSLHLTTATGAVELFPAGTLDVLRFFQRRHASLAHEVEYVACRPTQHLAESCQACGAGEPELFAYAVFRLREPERTRWSDLNALERRLKSHYGTFFELPRALELLERRFGDDLNDSDPPPGSNRIVLPPEQPSTSKGRFSLTETLAAMKADLSGVELISWIEAAFRQRPPEGEVEHRYYLDDEAQVYLVRDHFREGKALYKGQTAPEALGPVRR